VDMFHKLFLTSILAFIPTSDQAIWGMVIVWIYTVIILLRKPYYRKGDDRLALYAQVEIFLILLAGHIFYGFDTPSQLADVAMSLFLIVMVVGLLCFFALQSANIVSKIIKLAWKKRKAEFEKRQMEEEKEWTDQQREMASLNMYAAGNIMVETEQLVQAQEGRDVPPPPYPKEFKRDGEQGHRRMRSNPPPFPGGEPESTNGDVNTTLPPEGPHTVVRRVSNLDSSGKRSSAVVVARRGSSLLGQSGRASNLVSSAAARGSIVVQPGASKVES